MYLCQTPGDVHRFQSVCKDLADLPKHFGRPDHHALPLKYERIGLGVVKFLGFLHYKVLLIYNLQNICDITLGFRITKGKDHKKY
jgi:hypothetical protein